MGFGLGRKPVPGSVEDVDQLRAEVQGLHALVSSQSTRINALETRLLGGQPHPAAPTPGYTAQQVKSRTMPQPTMPGVSTGVPSAQPGLSAGDTLSPHLKVVGQLQLGAPLASAALSVHLPASKNSAVPRYGAAAEASGRIHLFDSLGRPVAAVLEPPDSAPDSAAPPPLLAFGSKEPALLYVATADPSTPSSFSLRQYRLINEQRPQPGARTRIALAKNATVGWHVPARKARRGRNAAEAEAEAAAAEAEAVAAAEVAEAEAAAAVASGAPLPQLVSLETIPSRSASSPALLAARSDGRLLMLGAAGNALSSMDSGVQGVIAVVRGGSGLAVLSTSRLVLVDLGRRDQPRECPVPEATLQAEDELQHASFDLQLPQLLFVSTRSGQTLLFNTRTRLGPPPEESGRRAAAPVECRWVDTLEGAGAGSTALASVRGYLLELGAARLRARNVSALYRGAELLGSPLIHDETLPPAAILPATPPAKRSPKRASKPAALLGGAARPPIVASGGGVLMLARGDGAVRLLHSTLPFEVAQPSLFARYGMGAIVIGVTVLWQLYRRGKGGNADAKKGNRGRDEAEAMRGGGRNSKAMQGMRRALGDDGAAEQLYQGHMRAYGQAAGAGPSSGSGGGRGRGQRYEDDSDD